MELFGSDTEKMLHGYIGKTATTILIYVAIVAFAIFALSIIVGFGKSAFTTLTPFVPKTGWEKWADWAFRFLLIAGVVSSAIFTVKRIRKVESTYAEFQKNVGTFGRGLVGAGEHLDNRLKEHDGLLKDHEDRLKYIENKVGDKLVDMLVERELKDVRRRDPSQ